MTRRAVLTVVVLVSVILPVAAGCGDSTEKEAAAYIEKAHSCIRKAAEINNEISELGKKYSELLSGGINAETITQLEQLQDDFKAKIKKELHQLISTEDYLLKAGKLTSDEQIKRYANLKLEAIRDYQAKLRIDLAAIQIRREILEVQQKSQNISEILRLGKEIGELEARAKEYGESAADKDSEANGYYKKNDLDE